MPWKECHVMDERVRFVARLLDGEKMAVLCQEFGISRKTGYKIYDRYKDTGVRGLSDRSRRPYRHANQLPMAVEKTIVRLKKDYPSWGAPKLRERLKQKWPDLACPAISTVHAVLDWHGRRERGDRQLAYRIERFGNRTRRLEDARGNTLVPVLTAFMPIRNAASRTRDPIPT